MEVISEGRARILAPPGVFYNPHMKECRDLFTQVVGKLRPRKVVDAFAGTGIRGIRYMLSGVEKGVFVDVSPKAVAVIRENLRLNALSGEVILGRAEGVLPGLKADLVELDPFGSPVRYLASAVFALPRRGFLSVTATDTAVLAGAHGKACVRIYGAKALRGPLCHEAGLRILLARVGRSLWEAGYSMRPVLSFSRRHYMKVLVEARFSRSSAFSQASSLSFLHYCPRCGNSWMGGPPRCDVCGAKAERAGPLWSGPLFGEEVEDTPLGEEARAGGNFYDLHDLARRLHRSPSPVAKVVNLLRERGFPAARSHLRPWGIRTPAEFREVLEVLLEIPGPDRR